MVLRSFMEKISQNIENLFIQLEFLILFFSTAVVAIKTYNKK